MNRTRSHHSTNANTHGGNRGARHANRRTPDLWERSNPADAGLLLSRLDGVKGAGKGWRARCPSHGGASGSLSIVESESGRVLVRCHAGCSAQAITEAAGLSLAALCPTSDSRQRGRAVDVGHAAALIASARRRRGGEELQRHIETAARALSLWECAGKPNVDNPYLRSKNVGVFGIREIGGWLLIPMRDADSFLWNVQRIGSNGCKLFERGARKRGLFHLLGGPVAGVLCICEGYATAASVHAATGYPVAVAFDAGNLEPVACNLRAAFPSARIIVCADDDSGTAARTGRNPGMEAATAAARAVAGLVARPMFGGAA